MGVRAVARPWRGRIPPLVPALPVCHGSAKLGPQLSRHCGCRCHLPRGLLLQASAYYRHAASFGPPPASVTLECGDRCVRLLGAALAAGSVALGPASLAELLQAASYLQVCLVQGGVRWGSATWLAAGRGMLRGMVPGCLLRLQDGRMAGSINGSRVVLRATGFFLVLL